MVKYYDENRQKYIFDENNYIVDLDSFVNRVVLNKGKLWPVVRLQSANAVRVRFIAGYRDTAYKVPEYEEYEEKLTGHYIQIDVWSKNDYTELIDMVKNLLIQAGFRRLNEMDLYEEDTKIYHKGLKFYYIEES